MTANKYMLTKISILFTILLATSSCVEEYWPEIIINNNQTLIVDGRISNFPGPYTVNLSAANSINDTAQIHISSAKVTIVDSNGDEELLSETSPGIYKSSPNGMQGIVGHHYKIKIILDSGKQYESEFEEMQNPVAVESLSVEESVHFTEDDLKIEQEGYQFYINSQEAQKSKTYLYWEIEETYEYHAAHKISFSYDGNFYPKTIDNPYGITRIRDRYSLFYCWTTQNVPERFSYSTEYLGIPKVNNLPLHFIPFTDSRLRHRYSILVTQYTISEDAYVFIDKLNKQNGNSVEMFTSQPFQIRGNIVNIKDPSEAVLGYFMVASGMVGSRLYTKAPPRIRYRDQICELSFGYDIIMAIIDQATATAASQPVFFIWASFPDETADSGRVEGMAYVHRECIDCETKGGTVIKPEYWDW